MSSKSKSASTQNTPAFLTERQLRSSTKLFDLLFDGIAFVNKENVIIYVNPSFASLFGSSMDKLQGTSVQELYKSDNQVQKLIAEKLKRRKQGISETYELKTHIGSNEVVWLEIRAIPVMDDSGEITGSLAICRNVVKEKQTSEQLRNSEQFLDSVVQHLPNMVFVKEAEGLSFVSVNKAGEELIGIKESELKGKTDFDFFPKKQAEFFTNKDRQVFEDGGVLDIPIEKMSSAVHGERWLHTKKVPIYDSMGNPKFLLGISEDITEKLKAEETLNAQLSLENLVASISSRFVQARGFEELEEAIQESLELVGSVAEVNRATIYLEKDGVITKSFAWHSDPEDFTKGKDLQFEISNYTSFLKQISEQGYFYMPSINKLPKSAVNEKVVFGKLGIKSSVVLPLKGKDEFLGYMILNQTEEHRKFERDQIALFLIASQVFANGIEQRNASIRLRQHLDLEKLVTDISTRLINIHGNSITIELRKSIKKVRKSLGLNWAWVVLQDVYCCESTVVADGQKSKSTKRLASITPFFQALCKYVGKLKGGVSPRLISSGSDIKRDQSIADKMHSLELNELLICPVRIGEREVCTLVLGSDQTGVFNTSLVDLLRTLSKTCSNAIDRMRFERKLEESRELYRTLADNIPESSVLLFNRDLVYLVVEGAALEQQGYARESIEGRSIYEVMDHENLSFFEPLFKGVFEGDSTRMEKQLGKRHFKIHILPVRDDKGEIFAGMFMSFDITELKQIENTLQVQAKELKRSNQDLEMFAYAASHDLREPLRMITNYIDLIAEHLEEREKQEIHEFMHFVSDGAKQMQALIDDLLAYARADQKELIRKKTDVTMCANVAIKNLESIIREKGAVVSFPSLPEVYGDSRQLVRLFQNLISNGIRFSGGKKPTVEISFKELPNDWKFSIKDEGIGIEKDFLERIFVIFKRLHSRGEYPGTGIGLALCKKIVERHNGRIWAESTFGKGSTFNFTISKPIIE